MIIWDDKADGSDHDKHLTKCLQVTRQNNLKLNFDKLQFTMKQASFLLTTFTSDGCRPENDKIKVINKIPQHTNVRPMFLGMVNYLKMLS